MTEIELQQKKARIEEIDQEIENLCNETKDLEFQIAEHESQFKKGDLIEWDHGKGSRKGRVDWIVYSTFMDHDLMVTPILKNGNDGSQVTVRCWNNPRKVQE